MINNDIKLIDGMSIENVRKLKGKKKKRKIDFLKKKIFI